MSIANWEQDRPSRYIFPKENYKDVRTIKPTLPGAKQIQTKETTYLCGTSEIDQVVTCVRGLRIPIGKEKKGIAEPGYDEITYPHTAKQRQTVRGYVPTWEQQN